MFCENPKNLVCNENSVQLNFSASKMEFLVTYQARKRIIQAEPRYLAEECGVAFDLLTQFRMEVWNDEWDSWVDYNAKDVPKKPKIRMVDVIGSQYIVVEESTNSVR